METMGPTTKKNRVTIDGVSYKLNGENQLNIVKILGVDGLLIYKGQLVEREGNFVTLEPNTEYLSMKLGANGEYEKSIFFFKGKKKKLVHISN